MDVPRMLRAMTMTTSLKYEHENERWTDLSLRITGGLGGWLSAQGQTQDARVDGEAFLKRELETDGNTLFPHLWTVHQHIEKGGGIYLFSFFF